MALQKSSVGEAYFHVHCIERVSISRPLTIGIIGRGLWQICNIVGARDPVR
jgi:hypothetical protein